MTTFEMSEIVQNSLSGVLMESNQNLDIENNSKQIINLNGSYLFQDEESMDMLLNKIGLAVQRKGGR